MTSFIRKVPAVRFLAAALLLGLTIPGYGIRPSSNPENVADGPVNPYKNGFKNLQGLSKDDLLNEGEKAIQGKVKLSGNSANGIIARLNSKWRGDSFSANFLSEQQDKLGNTHIRLQQLYKSIPVVGSEMIVHVNPQNEIYAVSGKFAEDISLDVNPAITAASAINSVRQNLGKGNIQKAVSNLVIFDGHLAFEVEIPVEAPETPALWKAYMDAGTGELLFKENKLMHAAPVGGSENNVSGNRLPDEDGSLVDINGWLDNTSQYFLWNSNNLWGVFNEDAADWEQNNTGLWANTDPAAVSLAKNMEIVQDYVTTVLGQSSFDNAGAFATANVHVNTNYVNAYWDGSQLYFGDGDGVTANALTTLDIAAHEFGHAITDYTSDLVYSYESGALNESYSDILGALVEFYGQPDARSAYPLGVDGEADWMMGEDSWLSDEALRDLRDPQRFGQPSYYQGTYWYTGSGDNGGVHTNSGVQNFVFYLLSEGGTGTNDGHAYSITGLGIEQAGEIAMYANRFLLTANSNYRDSRDAWILAATTLGYNAATVSDVWAAAGLAPLVKNLAVSPTSLDFGSVGVGAASTLELTLSNSGGEATIVSGISTDNAVFTTGASLPFQVPAGGNLILDVVFIPTSESSESGALTISSDAADNPSLGVNLSGNGVPPSAIVYSPGAISETVGVGGSATATLTIENSGGADLAYNLSPVVASFAATIPPASYSPEHFQILPKGAPDNRIGQIVPNGSGGPDMYGYKWSDSDEPSGPTYVWNNISTTGTVMSTISGCDDCTQLQSLSFPFNFYGTDYSSMYVSSNGVITFGTSYSGYTNYPLPSTSAPANVIAGFWDDLRPGGGGNVYFQDFGTYAIVQFNAVAYYSGSGSVTFQFVLHDNGKINLYYNSLTGTVLSSTVGIQNSTRDDGLGVVYNASYLRNSLAVEFSAGPDWLSLSTESGTLASGESINIDVILDATDLLGGSYNGTIELSHNDPAESNPIVIPVNLYVDGMRRLNFTATSHDFGNVWQGASSTYRVEVVNAGDELTTINAINGDNTPTFDHDGILPLTVPAFGSASFNVSFNPSALGSHSGNFDILSDAEDNPSLTFSAIGTATSPPSASLSPLSFTLDLNPASSPVDLTSVLGNSGGDVLEFQIVSVQETSSPTFNSNSGYSLPTIQNDKIYSNENYANAFVPGNIIVALKNGQSSFFDTQVLAAINTVKTEELALAINPKTGLAAHQGRKLFLITIESQEANDVIAAIQTLILDQNVAYAEPNYLIQLGAIPDDASFSQLYGMHNIGQSGGTLDADIDAVEAWDIHTGNKSVTIGVIDTGIDYLHPDLVDNIWVNAAEASGTAGVDDDGNGFIDDIHGWDFAYGDANPMDGHYHGTHCAGTIAGRGNNGIGVAGVMWDAQLMAIKFLDDGGSGSTANAISSVNYANAMGVHITSNSWGGGGFSQALMDEIALGGLFVAAAGNSNSNNDSSPHYPSSYDLPNVLAVAATDRNDAKASFSSYGLTSVDLGAPGVDTYSCSPGNSYRLLSGTSMATPHVSGAAGLIWSLNPSLTFQEVKNILMNTVDQVPSMNGITVTGGRLNVNNAIAEVGPNWLTAGPAGVGTVNPGGTQDLFINVNPAELLGGTYTGEISVATNDPSNSSFIIEVTLNVDGFRSLTANPTSLDFGDVWNGSSTSLLLTLVNNSNEATSISSITSDNSVFTVSGSFPIVVSAYSSVEVSANFSPDALGAETGILTISSNAEDNPSLTISLNGNGIEPPGIVANPLAYSETVLYGDSLNSVLNISNDGGDVLNWGLEFETLTSPTVQNLSSYTLSSFEVYPLISGNDELPVYNPNSVAAPSIVIQAADLTGKTIAFDLVHSSSSSATFSVVSGDLAARGATVIDNSSLYTEGILAGIDVIYMQDPSSNWSAAEEAAIDGWLANGGAILYQGDQPGSMAPFFNKYGITYTGPYSSGISTNIMEHSATEGVDTLNIPGPVAGLILSGNTELLVEDISGNPFSAAAIIGAGAIISVCDEIFTNNNMINYKNRLFANTAVDWLATGGNGSWLKISQSEGNVNPAETANIPVLFNGVNVTPGNYTGELTINHNVPATNAITIPVSLYVDGVRNLDVSPLSHDFGNIWIGSTSTFDFILSNPGSEATQINSINISGAEFTHNLTLPATVAADGALALTITYSPIDLDADVTTITIISDAEDNPSLTVNANGAGVEPPQISITPSAISEAVVGEEIVDVPLTVENLGGDDLVFTARGAESSPLAPSFGAVTNMNVGLLATSTSFSTLQSHLQAMSQVANVEFINGNLQVPLLESLLNFDVVVVASNTSWYNQIQIGDVLADYVDAGGRVVILGVNFHGTGTWALQGRIMTPEYSPIGTASNYSSSTATLGTLITHPITEGVSTLSSSYYALAIATQGLGVSLGSYSNGYLVGAYNPEKPIVNLNVYTASNSYWSGDFLILLENAMRYTATPPWLSVQNQGTPITVPAGSSTDVIVSLGGAGVLGGDYSGMVEFSHNVPGQTNPLSIPVDLNVDGIKSLTVTPSSNDFGNVWVGQNSVFEFELANNGTEETQVNSITIDNAEFSYSLGLPIVLTPGNSQTFEVTFSPADLGTESGTLTINSDAEDNPSLPVTLSGTGVEPPQISITPSAISEAVVGEEIVDVPLTVENLGGDDLVFTARGINAASVLPGLGAVTDMNVGLLATSNTTYSTLESQLQAMTQVANVELINGSVQEPQLDSLLNFDVVVVASNSSWYNQIQIGDVLADYVDAGGRVVLLGLNFHGTGNWVLQGRIMTPDYSPISAVTTYSSSSASLGTLVSHPITEGVSSLTFSYYAYVTSTQGQGQSLGTLTNGYLIGAYNPEKSIVNLNVYAASNSYWSGDFLILLENAMRYTSTPPWLNVQNQGTPITVPAGGSTNVIVSLGGTGVLGGDYTGIVEFNHNVPGHTNPLSIPVDLNVDGIKSLTVTPGSHDFGNVWAGQNSAFTFVLENNGTEQTQVNSITIDNAEFSYSLGLPIVLTPGNSQFFEVTFSPVDLGTESGTLTINSDAEYNPSLPVTLNGTGIAPPEISVSPANISDNLGPDEISNHILSVDNLGGDVLSFNLDVDYLSNPLGVYQLEIPEQFKNDILAQYGDPLMGNTQSPMENPGPFNSDLNVPLAGENVLLIRDALPWSKDVTEPLLVTLGAIVTIIPSSAVATTDFAQFDLIVTSSVQSSTYYSNLDANMARFENYISSGGIVFYNSCTFSGITQSIPNSGTVSYSTSGTNYIMNNEHPIVEGVTSPITGNSASHNFISVVPNGADTIITNVSNQPTLIEYDMGAGTVLVSTLTLEYYYPSGLAEFLFPNAMNYLLQGAVGNNSWISADISSGTVDPGSSRDISIELNSSNLLAGEYTANLNLIHNSPLVTNPLNIPVTLNVAGESRLSVSPTNLDFGSIWVGNSSTLQIVLENTGNQPTQVTNISTSNPIYTITGAFPISVDAFSSVTVDVSFNPSSPGVESAVLTITSNADDNPTLTVSSSGEGVEPPSIAVSPADISTSLAVGSSEDHQLSISNAGGDNLDWSIDFGMPTAWPGVIDILIYTRGADMTGEYLNVVSSITNYAPSHTITNSVTTDSLTLAAELADKEVFIIMEQESIPIPSGLGTTFATVLDAFLQRGGTIIYHFPGHSYNPASFLSEAGLMDISYAGLNSGGAIVIEDPTNELFTGITSTVYMNNACAYYSVSGSAEVLASYSSYAAIAENKIHSGRVITMAPDFYTYNANWAQILSNAVALGPTIPPWLQLSRLSGTTPASGSSDLVVTINAEGLAPGTYNQNILISHNAPGQTSPQVVSVSLTVTGIPGLGRSRIFSVGPAATTVSAGTTYNLWKVQIGGVTQGVTQGTGHKLLLK